MRTGVYIDAFNLYYGGRSHAGGGSVPGWRWLDVRALASTLLSEHAATWPDAHVERVVYCTARISSRDNAEGHRDQDVYLKALVAARSVDHIEYGYYRSTIKYRPLAVADRRLRPVLVNPVWPVKVKNGAQVDDPAATFMVSVADREEKGTDVNIASHLLLDVPNRRVDAAVVISNDSDLALPIKEARQRVPVGTVRPGVNHLAGALRGDANDGAGRHWWKQLTVHHYTTHQLPDPVDHYRRPMGW